MSIATNLFRTMSNYVVSLAYKVFDFLGQMLKYQRSVVLNAATAKKETAYLSYVNETFINKDPKNPYVQFLVQPGTWDLWQGVSVNFTPRNSKEHFVEFTLEIPKSNLQGNPSTLVFTVNASNLASAYDVYFYEDQPITITVLPKDDTTELMAGVFLMDGQGLTNWNFKKAVLRWV